MIKKIFGDITTAEADAIVNAANATLLGGGGVDGAIHRAAGDALMRECMALPAVNGVRCRTGEAKITGAGNLKARFVIHTVGPVYRQSSEPARELASCYRSSLELALQYDCKSIAFPAISTGVYGYPKEEAKEIALFVCGEFEAEIDIALYFF